MLVAGVVDAPPDTISDPTVASEPATIESDELPRGAPDAPPSKDINSIIYINKTNRDTPAASEDINSTTNCDIRKATATVRYEFSSLFPEALEEDDWPLFGWAVKNYGLDTCMSKLEWMREFQKANAISNPKGLFRMSLAKDYQPSAWIAAKMKADRRAELASERSRKELDEWGKHVEDFNFEAATVSLQRLLDALS